MLVDFDMYGGASPELVAWELVVSDQDVVGAWATAIARGWIARPGRTTSMTRSSGS